MTFKHHNRDPQCPGCEDRLIQGHPEIVRFFNFFKEKTPDLHCSWVYRDKEMQDEAYASGKSRAHFPNSKHNLEPSQAVDIFQIDEDGKAVFSKEFCESIHNEAIENGFNVRWGGDFKSLGDYGHFELK